MRTERGGMGRSTAAGLVPNQRHDRIRHTLGPYDQRGSRAWLLLFGILIITIIITNVTVIAKEMLVQHAVRQIAEANARRTNTQSNEA